MRDKLLLLLGALILVCVAGCFYIAAHRYTFVADTGAVLKMDNLTGRVWLVTRDQQTELGKGQQ